VSIRRACRLIEFDSSTYHYRSCRPDQAAIKARMKEIAETRVRYGYRRVHVLLKREGWNVNHKRTYKLYKEMGLQLRNKTPKRRVKAKLREDRQPAVRPNEVWAMDFLHDQLATGQKIRVLTVIDTFSRFLPALDARFSYRGEDVVATLERVCRAVGYPKAIRVDQGSEFISRDFDLWAYAKGVTLDFSRPGMPTDNAFAEAFNSRVRAECMNTHWFLTLADAREKLKAWRSYYNDQRPHGTIGNKAPISLQKPGDAASPSP
jgi:putative transposase